MNRTKLIVGRKWNNPEIYTIVTNDKIEFQISLDDFINALVEEAGSPISMVTKSGLKTRLETAASKIVSEIKLLSAKVV